MCVPFVRAMPTTGVSLYVRPPAFPQTSGGSRLLSHGRLLVRTPTSVRFYRRFSKSMLRSPERSCGKGSRRLLPCAFSTRCSRSRRCSPNRLETHEDAHRSDSWGLAGDGYTGRLLYLRTCYAACVIYRETAVTGPMKPLSGRCRGYLDPFNTAKINPQFFPKCSPANAKGDTEGIFFKHVELYSARCAPLSTCWKVCWRTFLRRKKRPISWNSSLCSLSRGRSVVLWWLTSLTTTAGKSGALLSSKCS